MFFLFFLIIGVYFLIKKILHYYTNVYCLNIYCMFIVGVPAGIQTKEAKTKIETHPLTVEARINKCLV